MNTGTTAGTVAAGDHTHSGYAASSHQHAAGDITGGTIAIARIPTGTSSTQVSRGDHTHSGYLTSTTIQTSAVTITSNQNNQSNPFSLNNGQQGTVVYYNNSSSSHTVPFASSGVKWPDNSAPTITIPAYGYCEVNYFNISGTVYARAV